MKWGVEVELPSGTVELCLFGAENEEEAQSYVHIMRVVDQYPEVFNLKQLPEGATVNDLYKLFPLPVVKGEVS